MLGRLTVDRLSKLSIFAVVAIVGCETLHNAGVPGLESFVKTDPAIVELERTNREKFSVHKDHKALYWLLENRVSNGMKLREVEDVLGVPGELTKDFDHARSNGSHQTTDEAYKWGPDTIGYSVVIWFRDGHVSNFNPKDFRQGVMAGK